MTFHSLFISPLSATFELDNSSIFHSEHPFNVIVNGETMVENCENNVFSIYGLKPDADYRVEIEGDSLDIHTKPASLILNSEDFQTLNGDDTLTLQSAISLLPKDGVLIINEGTYRITSLFLKSDMTLYLEKGAKLEASLKVEDYPIMPAEKNLESGKRDILCSWEGNAFPGKPAIINVYNATNVNILGLGEIDGRAPQGQWWRDVKHLPWARPNMIYIKDSSFVTLQGITVENSPSWTIHPYFSSNLKFLDFDVKNPKDAPNTDGMDPESCVDVDIIGVRFSVGDDCIALKSGKIDIGSYFKQPCRKIRIRNCYMHEGHGAITLGSEAGAGIQELEVSRCLFSHTDRGLRIKSRRGRGKDSVFDGIEFSDIKMEHVLTPLVVNMFYFCDPDGKSEYVQKKEKMPVDDSTPRIGSFLFQRLECTDCEWAFGVFYGLPEQPIGSITIKDSHFTMAKNASEGLPAMMLDLEKMSKAGFVFHHVYKVVYSNVKVEGNVGPTTQCVDVAELENQ